MNPRITGDIPCPFFSVLGVTANGNVGDKMAVTVKLLLDRLEVGVCLSVLRLPKDQQPLWGRRGEWR